MAPTSSADQTAHWIQVHILAPPAQAEAAADFLFTLTGRGVELNEEPGPPDLVEVKGFLLAGPEAAAQQAAITRFTQELCDGCGAQARLDFRDLPDQDWGENWKKHFKPRALTDGLLVAPPWEEAAPAPGQKVIIIDPGQAFGTGQHESTLLCLRRLERQAKRDLLPGRLLDVGSGTGILALAFLLLGGQAALGLDIDPLAVEAAQHNAGLNGLEQRFSASLEPLEKLEGRWPLITANLTAPDLAALAPELARHLEKGGQLIASGILLKQVDQVRQAFLEQGLALLEQDSLNGWASLVFA